MPSRRFGLDGGSCKQLYALSELSVVRRAPGRGGSPSRPSRTELPTRNRGSEIRPYLPVDTQCFHQ